MFVIGAVEGARRQQHHVRRAGAIGRRDRGEHLAQLLRIIRHRRHRMPSDQVREQAQHRLAVFEHVGHARRRAAIILEHVEVARVGAHDVDAGDMGIDALRRIETLHLGAEGFVVQDQALRDDAGAENVACVINVVEEGVQRHDALRQAARQHVPLGGAEDARHDIEWDESLRIAALGIDREGDADAAEQQLRLFLLQLQQFARRLGEPAPHDLIGLTAMLGVAGLVEGGHGSASVFFPRNSAYAIDRPWPTVVGPDAIVCRQAKHIGICLTK